MNMQPKEIVKIAVESYHSLKTIRFSEDYFKLSPEWEGTLAYLDYVRKVNLEDQMPMFLEYDTKHANGNYPLPKKGEFIILGFIHESGAFFTTLRRYTLDKYNYYGNEQGNWFKLARAELVDLKKLEVKEFPILSEKEMKLQGLNTEQAYDQGFVDGSKMQREMK